MHPNIPSSLFLALFLLVGCQSDSQGVHADVGWPATISLPDVPLSVAPFDQVNVNWKQRLREPYIYFAHKGDYRLAGKRIAELLAEAQRQGAPIQGAPFILYYDDPGVTVMADLNARICIAIDDSFNAMQPLLMDDLPAKTVAYAAVSGPFPNVHLAYPGILGFMYQRGWQPQPPIREIFLVSPADHRPEELVTEVQIPWTLGG